MQTVSLRRIFSVKSQTNSLRYMERNMEGPLRGLLAGAAAWKFGGGCVSTILIFIIVFWLLGYVRC